MGIQTSGPVMVRPSGTPCVAEFQPLTVKPPPAVCPSIVADAEKVYHGKKVEIIASSPAAAKTRSGIAILRWFTLIPSVTDKDGLKHTVIGTTDDEAATVSRPPLRPLPRMVT